LSLELYSYWRSSASYRVRIALNLKSLSYVTHGVNLVKDGGDQWSLAYKQVNPQSRVPTLVHDGQRFTQSLAIIEYLDETFPDHRLIPARSRRPRACAHAVANHCLRHPAATEHQHHGVSKGEAQAR
jgi:maleylacetoacetate isomerase